MLWPALTLLALVAIVALHFWWHRKFLRAQKAARRDIETLERRQAESATQLRNQQDALFNSMAEGLLLLDETGRIQLANRAFAGLFGLTADIHNRTIMEAVRIHELAQLAVMLATESQVLGYELRLSPPNERWLQVNGAA